MAHLFAAYLYDGAKTLSGGNLYQWPQPPVVVGVVMALLFIVGYPATFFVSKWVNKQKKKADEQENLK